MMKVYYVRRKCVWSDAQHMSCVIRLYLSCMQKVCVYWVFWNDVISLWGMFTLAYVSLGSGHSTHLTSCFLAKRVGVIEKGKAVLAEEGRVFVVTLRTLGLVQVSCVQIQDRGGSCVSVLSLHARSRESASHNLLSSVWAQRPPAVCPLTPTDRTSCHSYSSLRTDYVHLCLGLEESISEFSWSIWGLI